MAKTNCETCQHDEEIWKDIPGYEGKYQVSSRGRVKSMSRVLVDSLGRKRKWKERILKPGDNGNGYEHVQLGVRHSRRVHSLVLEAFIGQRKPGDEACHNDGNRKHNCVANLRWDSRAENHDDKWKHGTVYQRNRTHCKRGHAYAGENLMWVPGRRERMARRCKSCEMASRRIKGKLELKPLREQIANEYYQRLNMSPNRGNNPKKGR